jgi:hypothetical protein
MIQLDLGEHGGVTAIVEVEHDAGGRRDHETRVQHVNVHPALHGGQ